MVNLTIDNKNITVEENTTIMDAAKQNGIAIPSLCYLRDINEIAACRVCVVEVEGKEKLLTSCNNVVEEGMVIHTNSPKARRHRRTNVELILSQHDCKCSVCRRDGNCTLQKITRDLNIREVPFETNLEEQDWDLKYPLIRNSTKCIKCMRCVQICDKVQSLKIWRVEGTGAKTTINVCDNEDIQDVDCALCGQCVTHCPVGALYVRDDINQVFDILEDDEVISVVQVAPAVRAAWGEAMGLPRNAATEKRMAAALRKIGFDYVFDTVFSADLTIMEEGSEFLKRLPEIKESKLPMFTSCCPGWVRFIKSQYPQLVSRLSTAKSPQQMFGAITKSYYAEMLGVDRSKIRCISVMPCMAKKDERTWDGNNDVDVVITTREFNRLMNAKGITPDNLPEEDFDKPLGEGTGAGVIFGATGGVMEAALRSAYYLVTGENPDADAFKTVRGTESWKEKTFSIEGTEVKVAVVSGLANTRELIEAVLCGDKEYDFVEVMTCPGGCVNGGGQPIHDGEELAEVRADVLYDIDKKNEIRYSHENSEVLKCYKTYLGAPLSEKSHHLLHTEHEA